MFKWLRKLGRPPGAPYDGPVCFADGSHWAVRLDRAGNELGPDRNRRLLWVDPTPESDEITGRYVHAAADDPTHESLYGKRVVEVEVEA